MFKIYSIIAIIILSSINPLLPIFPSLFSPSIQFPYKVRTWSHFSAFLDGKWIQNDIFLFFLKIIISNLFQFFSMDTIIRNLPFFDLLMLCSNIKLNALLIILLSFNIYALVFKTGILGNGNQVEHHRRVGVMKLGYIYRWGKKVGVTILREPIWLNLFCFAFESNITFKNKKPSFCNTAITKYIKFQYLYSMLCPCVPRRTTDLKEEPWGQEHVSACRSEKNQITTFFCFLACKLPKFPFFQQ